MSVLVIQGSIVGLIDPLPEYSVEWCRRREYEAEADWNVYGQERAESEQPIDEFTSVRVDGCGNHGLSDSNLFDLRLSHWNKTRTCLLKLCPFFLLLICQEFPHLHDPRVSIEGMEWICGCPEFFESSPVCAGVVLRHIHGEHGDWLTFTVVGHWSEVMAID